MDLNISEVEEFQRSRVWLEIVKAINEELELIEADMDTAPQRNIQDVDASTGSRKMVFGFESLQGKRLGLKGVIRMPEVLIEDIEIDVITREKETKDAEKERRQS